MLALIMILCSPLVSGRKVSDLQRMNYGIVFEPEDQLQLAGESWTHTFEISLPQRTNLIDIFGCSKNKKTCDLVYEILVEINQIRQDTEVMINTTLDTITKLLPEKELMVQSRHRRSILPFIGDLSKSIFGTATMKDVELLARHINSLNKVSRNLIKSVEQHENDLSSYMTATDERMNNLVKGLEENHLAIEHIQTQLFQTFDNLEKSFSTMSVIISKQVQKSRQLEALFNEFLEGIYQLVEGKLSPHLINTETMISTLNEIQEILNRKYPGFHLVYKDPTHIYHFVDTIFARKGLKLYVSVKFPISPFVKPLSLFKVISFPVPVNDTSDHATQLLNLPTYFAISHDLQYYTTLESQELNACKYNKMIQCKFNRILTPVVQKSCVLSLFKNDKDLIKEQCNFRFLLNHISSGVVLLSQTSILVYKIDVLEFDCKSGKKMVEGCKFCTLNVPCECSVSTGYSFLPARLTDCHNDTSEKLHPVNLALLQQFFNDSSLNNIGTNSLFDNPLAVNVPQFKIYNHSINQILANDNKAHLSLQKMAQSAKNNSLIYQSLTESLLSGDITIEEMISTKDIILYVTASVATFCFIAFIFITVKLRKVLVILSMLQATNTRQVQAFTVPSFNYKASQLNSESSVYFWEQLDIEIDHCIIALNVIVIALLMIVLVNTCKIMKNSTKLIIEITNGKSTVQIPLKTLTLCPTYWQITVPQSIEQITIRGLWNPTVTFDWGDFEIKNKLTNQILPIESCHKINPLAAKKLRSIMTTTYCAYFFIQHGKLFLPLQSW